MAEESEGPDSGAQALDAGVDPAAIALALGSASRTKADRFLEEQTQLVMDQRHHLREQFKQLRPGLWEKRLGVILRVATAVVGIAVATRLGVMVWDAARSKGLVIEPFSVPPDLAARGITGDVVASQMIDKLTEMTTHELSRAVQSYANNWGDNIKVEIPETGVSIGELQSFLKEWLGHDIRISGEIFNDGNQESPFPPAPAAMRAPASAARTRIWTVCCRKQRSMSMRSPSPIAMPITWTAITIQMAWLTAWRTPPPSITD